MQKMLLGRRRGLRCTLPQDEFAFDAKKLGDAPALLVALGSRERLVDDREPFGSLTVATEGVGNLGENWSVKECKSVLRDVGKCGAEKLQPSAHLAALDEQHASKTPPPEIPQLNRLPSGKVHERLYVALRQGQIAGEKRDGAC